jgi:hypothetical protein
MLKKTHIKLWIYEFMIGNGIWRCVLLGNDDSLQMGWSLKRLQSVEEANHPLMGGLEP